MQFLNGKEIQVDENGEYDAKCSVCLTDKKCVSVSYQEFQEIYEAFNVEPHAFAVCQDCFKGDKKELYISLKDYLITDELYRWTIGDKNGIVRSDLEFTLLLNLAIAKGVLYREEKRIRKIYPQPIRKTQMSLVDMLKSQKDANVPDILYQKLLKNLYGG